MKFVLAGASALVLALAAGAAAQGPGPRRDGNWEVTMEMQMPNMPNMPAGFSMPPMKTTQCITPADAADPNKSMPSRGERGGRASDCKVSDYKAVGNKVTWNMVCTGPEPMTGTGEFIYATDSYTGTMIMNRTGAGGMAMTMKYSGKRLGDCKK